MSSIRQTQSWLRDILLILKKTKNYSLVIGYFNIFILFLLPSILNSVLLISLVMMVWPAVVTQIIIFYQSSEIKRISFFKIDSKIKKNFHKLLRIGLISFIYTLLVSQYFAPQIQNIRELAVVSDNSIEAMVIFKLIAKFFLSMLPLFAATWFSPMIVVFKGEGVFKALKLSITAVLIYIVPLLMTWISLIVIFALLIYFIQTILLFLGLPQAFNILIITVIFFSITAIYCAALFIFQFLGYKQIFKL